MKYLTVVRHAKSSWDHPGVTDHDRPLNARGLRAAPAVADFLQRTYFGEGEHGELLPPPALIHSSTAARALATGKHFQERLSKGAAELVTAQQLYLAEPDALMAQVRDLPDAHSHVVMVGHNPGLHDFCNRLLARTGVPRMPTCTAVILGLPHEHWGLTDWAEAQLIGYITPRTLERRFPEKYAGITRAVDEVG